MLYYSQKRGFTVIEAITASVILAFCVTSLSIALYNGFSLISDIRESIIASSIIQEEAEELRKTFFAALPPSGESSFTNDNLSLLHNASGAIHVDQYIDGNIARVLVKVTWYNRMKTDRQNVKKAVTLITKNGVNSI